MIRSELVALIAEQNPHLYARQIEAVVDTILNRIFDALAVGDRVELRGFGAFEARQHEPRIGRNPRTGKAVKVEARVHVRFKPGKTIQARLNRVEKDLGREAE